MVDCVEGLMRPGQCTLRMLRGYTSLLREHREGENRIFWKEEEDFWEKHRRRFTLRALSFLEYSCHLSIKVYIKLKINVLRKREAHWFGDV